jgi:hypothetical protein
VLKELRHQGEATITKTKAIDHHRLHRLAQGHAGMEALIEPIKILHQANFLANPSDDPQMIEPLHGNIRHENLLPPAAVRVSHVR